MCEAEELFEKKKEQEVRSIGIREECGGRREREKEMKRVREED